MARKASSNLPGYVIAGIVIFALGRCSAEKPSDGQASSLMAPVQAAAEISPTSDDAAADAAPVTAPNADAANDAAVSIDPAPAWQGDDEEFTCSGKRLCREMDSCAEANFYLNQCGLGRLDGDGDGVPCESIC